jgi:Rubrerythrin
MSRPLRLDKVRAQAEVIEAETKRFYARAAQRSQDASIRQLLGDLAAEERRHEAKAERLEAKYVSYEVREREQKAERRLCAADRAAGPRRPHGRLGLDPGATIRCGIRDPRKLAKLPCRACRCDRRRHLDGLRGSPVGQWLSGGAWQPITARPRLRRDDDSRRASGTRSLILFPISGRRPLLRLQPSRSSSASLPGCATATWTRLHFPRRSRSWWAACLFSRPAI